MTCCGSTPIQVLSLITLANLNLKSMLAVLDPYPSKFYVGRGRPISIQIQQLVFWASIDPNPMFAVTCRSPARSCNCNSKSTKTLCLRLWVRDHPHSTAFVADQLESKLFMQQCGPTMANPYLTPYLFYWINTRPSSKFVVVGYHLSKCNYSCSGSVPTQISCLLVRSEAQLDPMMIITIPNASQVYACGCGSVSSRRHQIIRSNKIGHCI